MRATFPANAPKPKSPSPATVVVRKATSRVNAQTRNPAAVEEVAGVPAVVAAADTLAVEARNATNVVKSATLLATALRVVAVEAMAAAVAGTVVVLAMAAAALAVAEEVKHATPAADSVTCHVTAPRVRSATTVSEQSLKAACWS